MTNLINPYYFGENERRLFGCYQPPKGGSSDRGVLLCYPIGHEYVRTHRVYRQLAKRLADSGFHVLRFDYYGTGDSAGEFEEARLSGWIDDIALAVKELRERYAAYDVTVVGMRLGASLAMLAGNSGYRIGGLVLWDPITDGRRYLKELEELQNERFRLSGLEVPGVRKPSTGELELIGYPISADLYQEIGDVDTRTLNQPSAERILMVETSEAAEQAWLLKHLNKTDCEVQYEHIPNPKIWNQNPYKILTPTKIIQVIVNWIAKKTT